MLKHHHIKEKPVRIYKKGDTMNTTEALILLKSHKKDLTFQQLSTLRGQIKSGNIEGAMKGLEKLMKKKVSA